MLLTRLLSRFRVFRDARRTERLMKLGRSDFARWSQDESLRPEWNERTELLARLVPSGSTVIEFGAGREFLRNCLPSTCRYTPSDLVARGAHTFVCDLNADQLPCFRGFNVAVFSGVLEYVLDVDRVFGHLRPDIETIIASYTPTDLLSDTTIRRHFGWVNDMSNAEVIELAIRNGYVADDAGRWENQRLYVFRRIDGDQGTSLQLNDRTRSDQH